MPLPSYTGTQTGHRTKGAVSGITEDGLVFYEIPYEFTHAQAGAFRQEWQRGAACPIVNWEHLALTIPPTIREGIGGLFTSTLRFEGPDINGEFGESEDTEEYFAERREIQVIPDPGSPKFQVTAIYFAPTAIISYVQDTRRTTPKAAPSELGDDPVPVAVTAWKAEEALDKPYTLDVLLTDHGNTPFWEVRTISGFSRVTRNSDGSWQHEEHHAKELTVLADN